MNTIEVPRWFDRHLHARDGEMLKKVLPYTFKQYAAGAVIMGNLPEPITTIERAVAYKERVMAARWSPVHGAYDFKPCMTCYLTDSTTPEEVVRGFKEGVWCAVKLYMADQQGQGGTTGSQHGVRNLSGRYPVFEAMQKHGIPLLGHFEAVEKTVDEFDREAVSVERDLTPLLHAFPGLTVVFEHITDGRAADFVAAMCSSHSLYATVTAHHLVLNRNALFSGGMSPDNYCKPVPKRETHRRRVRKYVTSGHPHFGAGTDSAPHLVEAKSRCHGCAAGIFTAPVAVELYTTVFDEDGALGHLGAFLSENFVNIYGVRVSAEKMVIERVPYVIPQALGVNVFMAGTELPWKVVGAE